MTRRKAGVVDAVEGRGKALAIEGVIVAILVAVVVFVLAVAAGSSVAVFVVVVVRMGRVDAGFTRATKEDVFTVEGERMGGSVGASMDEAADEVDEGVEEGGAEESKANAAMPSTTHGCCSGTSLQTPNAVGLLSLKEGKME